MTKINELIDEIKINQKIQGRKMRYIESCSLVYIFLCEQLLHPLPLLNQIPFQKNPSIYLTYKSAYR